MSKAFAVHLTFNGNCKQALMHYQQCFGGSLELQTLADSANGCNMEKEMKDVIVCAILKNHYFNLVGTDLTDDAGIIVGNHMSIFIQCVSFDERARLVNKLAGKSIPLRDKYARSINIVDKYRMSWILNLPSSSI